MTEVYVHLDDQDIINKLTKGKVKQEEPIKFEPIICPICKNKIPKFMHNLFPLLIKDYFKNTLKLFYLKKNNPDAYRYLLQKKFLHLLNLKDLEDLYNNIPKKDKVDLQSIESLILKSNPKKRRDLNKEHK